MIQRLQKIARLLGRTVSVASLGNVKSTVSTALRKGEPKMICVLEEEPAIVIMHKEEMDKPAM